MQEFVLESWVLEVDGRKFRATVERDDLCDAPWDACEGHGDVSDWTRRDKAPGEMILAESRGMKRFYDFAGAVKKARDEGWDAPPYKTGTKGQRAERAALADFSFLKAWCEDDWHYVGVVVTPLCACCDSPDESRAESLWGIESGAGEYLQEVAFDLARQVAPESVAA